MEGGGGGAIMVGWGRGHTKCRMVIIIFGAKNSKCTKFEKDLNENILSRKRENHTETLGGGMW